MMLMKIIMERRTKLDENYGLWRYSLPAQIGRRINNDYIMQYIHNKYPELTFFNSYNKRLVHSIIADYNVKMFNQLFNGVNPIKLWHNFGFRIEQNVNKTIGRDRGYHYVPLYITSSGLDGTIQLCLRNKFYRQINGDDKDMILPFVDSGRKKFNLWTTSRLKK